MNLKRRDVLRGLRKLGEIFQGGDHEKCRIILNGKKIRTFAIPSTTDFDDTLIGFVSKPLHVNNSIFGEICECTRDGTWYRDYLIGIGKL